MTELIRFLAFAMLLTSVPAAAVDEAPLPPWLVPVVQVLGEGRVLPTTGISLGQGRVLIASDFAPPGAQLMVLDGGTGLAEFGREAVVASRHRLEGLAVLTVPGLERPSPGLAPAPASGDQLMLLAYPPPAQIAAGERAVRKMTQLVDGSSGPVLAGGWPLPNLTGALVDACGNWVGQSVARGNASMASQLNTKYLWTAPLLQRLGIEGLALASCDRDWPEPGAGHATPAPAAVSESLTEAASQEPAPSAASAAEDASDTQESAEPLEPVIAEEQNDQPLDADGLKTDEAPEGDLATEPGPPASTGEDRATQDSATQDTVTQDTVTQDTFIQDTGDRSTQAVVPRSWAILALALGALIVLTIALFRRRGQANGAAEDEPVVTVLAGLVALDGSQAHPIGSGPAGVDTTIGRFDCTILLPGASISRRHARIYGKAEELFIEDLGSSYGSMVNGEALVPGEPRRLTFGDELFFADVGYRLVSPEQLSS